MTDEEIYRKLEEISVKQDTTNTNIGCLRTDVEVLKTSYDVNKKKVADHERFIDGNSTPGAKVRLSNIEQTLSTQRKGFWAIVSGIIALAAKAIWDVFTHLGAK